MFIDSATPELSADVVSLLCITMNTLIYYFIHHNKTIVCSLFVYIYICILFFFILLYNLQRFVCLFQNKT